MLDNTSSLTKKHIIQVKEWLFSAVMIVALLYNDLTFIYDDNYSAHLNKILDL